MTTIQKQIAITKIKEGITRIDFADDFMCDTEHIKLIHTEIKNISEMKNKKLFILYTFGKHTSITLEAIKFISKGIHSNNTMMEVYVVRSFSQRIMVRFLIKVLNPIVPVIYFNTINEAEEWFAKINLS